jgi:uncharacterized membrane protein YdjX (TVP38/TMEM64 family)
MQLLLTWIKAKPMEGGALLIVFYSVGLVVMFPSIVLSLAGGAIFGVRGQFRA